LCFIFECFRPCSSGPGAESSRPRGRILLAQGPNVLAPGAESSCQGPNTSCPGAESSWPRVRILGPRVRTSWLRGRIVLPGAESSWPRGPNSPGPGSERPGPVLNPPGPGAESSGQGAESSWKHLWCVHVDHRQGERNFLVLFAKSSENQCEDVIHRIYFLWPLSVLFKLPWSSWGVDTTLSTLSAGKWLIYRRIFCVQN